MCKSFELIGAFSLLFAAANCGEAQLGTPSSNASSASSSTSTGSFGGAAASSSSTGGSGGSDGSAPCNEPMEGGPLPMAYPFMLGGQTAWSHDDGHIAGYFHTYDALDVGGSAPHKVHVMLPRDYEACHAGYPVIYMNDGGGVFWNNSFGKSWNVPHALDILYKEGTIPKVIVVAIEPNDRNAEYSPTQSGPEQTCCKIDEYTNYITNHVKKFVDTYYRTNPMREATMIIGSSRGGLASFYMATRRPDVFGRAICMSSSFWAGLDPVFGGSYPGGPLSGAPLVTEVTGLLSNAAMRPRLWIDWGLIRTGGFHNEVIEKAATERGKEMVALLEGTYGYVVNNQLFWVEEPIGEHDETTWARRLPDALRAMYKP